MVNIDRKVPTQLQDYVAAAICGKNGFFLDLGCRHPIDKNNTYLLEKYYNWKGLLFDIDEQSIAQCQEVRTNPSYCMDVNSDEFINLITNLNIPQFDYVSFDIDINYNQEDPRPVPERALYSLGDTNIPFKFMTYEHDYYLTKRYNHPCPNRDKSREYLQDLGYFLLFPDVTPIENDLNKAWEDWWVHPELVSNDLLKKSKSLLTPNQILDLVTQE